LGFIVFAFWDGSQDVDKEKYVSVFVDILIQALTGALVVLFANIFQSLLGLGL